MKRINGVCTSAKVFTDNLEPYAKAQLEMLCNNEAFTESKIRIMPDVHPGKVGLIGFTATLGDRVLPAIVGIDMGCGITLVEFSAKKTEFQKLDRIICENIPSGFGTRSKPHQKALEFPLEELFCIRHIHQSKALASLGTLGGGNHFIELDKGEDGKLYGAVHSGSRHLGKEIADFYMREGQKILKEKGVDVPYEMTWLEGDLKKQYLHDLAIAADFAKLNREIILEEIAKGMKWKITGSCSAVHNYIETDITGKEPPIIRKGAISAKEGEQVIIPINMKEGIILGEGKGNPDWNRSAPHGAGRIMKREEVKNNHTLSQFKKEMKGIYCSSLSKETLDEAPFAYRNLEEIAENIKENVNITQVIKPVYNFKAKGKRD